MTRYQIKLWFMQDCKNERPDPATNASASMLATAVLLGLAFIALALIALNLEA